MTLYKLDKVIEELELKKSGKLKGLVFDLNCITLEKNTMSWWRQKTIMKQINMKLGLFIQLLVFRCQ